VVQYKKIEPSDLVPFIKDGDYYRVVGRDLNPELEEIIKLDSKKNHGLSNTFIKLFLKLLNDTSDKNIFEKKYLDSSIVSDVSLEEPYKYGRNKINVDIQVSLLDREKKEIHRIVIENKIKSSSASASQLENYYKAILENEPDLENLTFVFLTPKPKTNNSNLLKEFNHLKINQNKKFHYKCWLYWNNSDTALIDLFRKLLRLESIGEINPINEYLRHTIKLCK